MCGLMFFFSSGILVGSAGAGVTATGVQLGGRYVPGGRLCGLVVPCGKNRVSLRVSLGIALTIAPKTTQVPTRRLEMRKYISVSYSLSDARHRCLWLSCLRSELRKRKVLLLRFPITLQGLGIS